MHFRRWRTPGPGVAAYAALRVLVHRELPKTPFKYAPAPEAQPDKAKEEKKEDKKEDITRDPAIAHVVHSEVPPNARNTGQHAAQRARHLEALHEVHETPRASWGDWYPRPAVLEEERREEGPAGGEDGGR